MSASSGGPYTERRWVEPQLLPLTSQRTCMPHSLSLSLSLSLSHTHTRPLSHTLSDRWRRGDSDGRVWMIPSTPQRLGDEFLAIISPSLPPVPLTLAPCFPFQSLLFSRSLSRSLSLSVSPPPLLAHPLSYDNLFWLLTSCLSLIQYSGFSAIQPWPITTLHLASPWISWRSNHLHDKHHTAFVSGCSIWYLGVKGLEKKKKKRFASPIF